MGDQSIVNPYPHTTVETKKHCCSKRDSIYLSGARSNTLHCATNRFGLFRKETVTDFVI
jgi:hypothetical protein